MRLPHSDSSWPTAPEELAEVAADVPDDDLAKMSFENACRWYSFDPFAHRPRERCTVAALRAEVAGHDVAVRSFDHGRVEREPGISVGELAKSSTA